MSLISKVIKSLINGVSQQSPSARLDNQVESQVNMIPDIAGILTRRSPVSLDDVEVQDGSRVYGDEHAMFTMTIQGEKVSCGIKPDGTLYRFDENNANTTTITQSASAKTYLTHTDKDDISTVETSSSLLILNRGITVATETAPVASTNLNTRALFWVTNATVGATYKIFHTDTAGNKITAAEHVAIGSDTPKDIVTKLISGASVTDLTTTLVTTKLATFHQENNTCIVRGLILDYLEVECDYGDYIETIKEADFDNTKTMLDPAELPIKIATGVNDGLTPQGTANFLVRINPSVNEDLTTYYLRYSDDYDAWVEESNGYVTSIDNTTMPITIVKDTVATIDVAHSTFLPPQAGDDLSNPAPTIVGSTIKDMLIYNSRLGFASESTMVFSVIDQYYNLYRTTTSSYLISDAVDLELDSSKLGYAPIDNIFTMDNNIVINTGLAQSMLMMPQNLDISSAIFGKISSFDLGNNVPIPVRRSMYFPINQGSFSIIKSFQQDTTTGSGYTDTSVTKHCERYIRGNVVQSLFTNDIYMVRTDDDLKKIYLQHTYVSDGQVLQNAWHEWTFKYDIKYIYSSGDSIKLVFEDTANTQTLFGTLSLIPAEIVEDTDSQIGYIPYLDYYTEDLTLAGNLDSPTIVEKSLGKLVASGTANSVQGNTYTSSVELSEIIPRKAQNDGSMQKIGYVLLMLRRMAITLGYSGRFNVSVERTKRTVYNHNFIPDLLGNIVVGREPVNTREAKFPINGRSQDVAITVSTSDTFTPMQILSVEWQGQLISQGGR